MQKRRNCRNIKLSVRGSRGITVTMPWYVPFSAASAFVNKNREWILRQMQQSDNLIDIEQMRKEAKKYLPARLQALAQMHGFTFNRVAIKNNTSNWGSCSAKNNINLNLQLMRLPAELSDYVMLHELCHLQHHNHGTEFHQLLDSLCDGREKEYRRELRSWRLQ